MKEFETDQRNNLAELYNHLGVTDGDARGLFSEFMREDQRLMESHAWDFTQPDLTTNHIKDVLENIDPMILSPEEQGTRIDILWMWYHHAISSALQKKNLLQAKQFSEKAIQYHSSDNPNQITQLLYLLTHDNLEEAQRWKDQISDKIERETAEGVIRYYKSEFDK